MAIFLHMWLARPDSVNDFVRTLSDLHVLKLSWQPPGLQEAGRLRNFDRHHEDMPTCHALVSRYAMLTEKA